MQYYRPSNMVRQSVYHSREPCKNGLIDQDAIWVEDSGRPKEPHKGPDAHRKGQLYAGEGAERGPL